MSQKGSVHKAGLSSQSKNQAAVARRKMVFGAIWCIVGVLFVSVLAPSAASNQSGIFIIAWVAIILGGIQLLRGFSQYNQL